jgi:hypothetical protein
MTSTMNCMLKKWIGITSFYLLMSGLNGGLSADCDLRSIAAVPLIADCQSLSEDGGPIKYSADWLISSYLLERS